MGNSLRFGLALLATVIVTGGCGSLGASKKTGAGKVPGQVDVEQPKGGAGGAAATSVAAASGAAKRESAWVVLPLLSSNPKLGTVYGVGGAWIHHLTRSRTRRSSASPPSAPRRTRRCWPCPEKHPSGKTATA